MDMEENKLSRPVAHARMFAVVPVVLIAGAVIAFLLGFRTEGRKPMESTWRTHTAAEHEFVVTMPGVLIVNYQTMNFDGQDVTGRSYVASDRGADLSVTAFRRPDTDTRTFADVAQDLGMAGDNPTERAGGLTAFTHDTAEDNTRTQAVLLFHERMMYQMMVKAPAKAFPTKDAERFFASFRRSEN